MATGFVGGGLLALISVYGLIMAIRLIRLNSPAAWIGLLYIQYSTGSLLSGTIYTNCEFWYLYAGVVASSNLLKKVNKSNDLGYCPTSSSKICNSIF